MPGESNKNGGPADTNYPMLLHINYICNTYTYITYIKVNIQNECGRNCRPELLL